MPLPLRLGRIDYLNVWHVFQLLTRLLPEGKGCAHLPGHPSQLNLALREGLLDVSPSSSFEYLEGAEKYVLLSGHGICARHQVQSVLLLSPTPLEGLASWMAHHPGAVFLSSASATSSVLLRVLWRQAWKLPEPTWQQCTPGQGMGTGRPHLEIGNIALRLWLNPPPGWHVIDLATAWHRFTGLPFVFAVWIVRHASLAHHRDTLLQLQTALTTATCMLPDSVHDLAPLAATLHGIPAEAVLGYWRSMHTDLGPEEHAALVRFGAYATELGLLSGMPALRWFPEP